MQLWGGNYLESPPHNLYGLFPCLLTQESILCQSCKLNQVYTGVNTCRLRAKGEGEKGQETTFNPYPFTFSPNQIPS
ncbi:hypothetical protein NIES37_26900 [Tolypothrix tenuis PCC 7101]|uniref:Uncharacterized protein n=1 Tax=Tolypothrix tenuis PCC 7101 TaxID=231146 RepID=A0A1Z4MZ34_9CYAN|nr:hypothetical protein NIES37_26900 [Tolypothrix tenuis PCC 7101]BAZ77345.1 hypothetical protein NIES50_59740 [Aulosira laxa NIES-50]